MNDFVCRRCAACCRWPGHVLLTEKDIAALASHMRMDTSLFIERYCVLARNRAQLALAETPNGACVFLDGNDCCVYSVRPLQCRQFPLNWSVEGCPAAKSRNPNP